MEQHPNYEIKNYIEKDFHAYFESDTRWRYDVVNKKTKRVVMSFTYEEYGSTGGWDYSGIDKIIFSDDGKYVVTTSVDGKVEKHLLPVRRARKKL